MSSRTRFPAIAALNALHPSHRLACPASVVTTIGGCRCKLTPRYGRNVFVSIGNLDRRLEFLIPQDVLEMVMAHPDIEDFGPWLDHIKHDRLRYIVRACVAKYLSASSIPWFGDAKGLVGVIQACAMSCYGQNVNTLPYILAVKFNLAREVYGDGRQ